MEFIQPVMNLGTLGSVSSGKSTCIFSLTGTKTQRQSSEKVRNITIKPGYCNMKIWDNEGKLSSTNSSIVDNGKLINHISFVDCPGHHQLTQIMLGMVDLMKGAIVVISMKEDVDTNDQLIEHLNAAKLAGIEDMIVCLNKCDLVNKDIVKDKYIQVLNLFDKIGLKKPLDIIPTSFNRNFGVNYLLLSIMNNFNKSKIDNKIKDKPYFVISRSFDINKPGINILDIKGGVLGGSMIHGELSVNDTIVIKPGLVGKDGKTLSIKTTIKSLQTDNIILDNITPGGLMAIRTDINPHITKNDRMVGNIICLEDDDSFEITSILNIKPEFINDYSLKNGDKVSIQIGPMNILGLVTFCKKNKVSLKLNRPVCYKKGCKIYLAKTSGKYSVIGYAIL